MKDVAEVIRALRAHSGGRCRECYMMGETCACDEGTCSWLLARDAAELLEFYSTQQKAAPPTTRAEALEAARLCVCGEREEDYGSPEDNFRTISDLWAAYLRGCGIDVDFLEPYDVAAMMMLLKIGRITSDRAKADNWIDAAGYAACGCELQTKGEARRNEPGFAFTRQR